MFRFYVEQLKTKFLVRCVRSFTDSSPIVGRPFVSLGHQLASQPGQAFLELELDNERRRGRSAVARRDWYQQQLKTLHNNNHVGRCTRTHRYPSSGPGGDQPQNVSVQGQQQQLSFHSHAHSHRPNFLKPPKTDSRQHLQLCYHSTCVHGHVFSTWDTSLGLPEPTRCRILLVSNPRIYS